MCIWLLLGVSIAEGMCVDCSPYHYILIPCIAYLDNFVRIYICATSDMWFAFSFIFITNYVSVIYGIRADL